MPEALELRRDMPSVDAGRYIQFERFTISLKNLESCIESITKMTENSKESETSLSNLTRCSEDCGRILHGATRSLTDSKSEFGELCDYLGEKDSSPEIIFGSLLKFLSSIENCTAKVVEKSKRKEKLNSNALLQAQLSLKR